MTKRDVAVWFCRVWALVGGVGATFALGGAILNWLPLLGAVGGAFGLTQLSYSLPHLALSVFLWLFATSIGTELAAEGEYGPPMTSVADLRPLMARCVGLALVFSTSGSLFLTLFQIGIFHFQAPTSLPATIIRSQQISAAGYAMQSILGFLLAFTPRIRQFFGK